MRIGRQYYVSLAAFIVTCLLGKGRPTMLKNWAWTRQRYASSSTCPTKIHLPHVAPSCGQIGEFAREYIEIRRDFLDWKPPSNVFKGRQY